MYRTDVHTHARQLNYFALTNQEGLQRIADAFTSSEFAIDELPKK